jgi:hypothetical protein
LLAARTPNLSKKKENKFVKCLAQGHGEKEFDMAEI